MKHAVMIMAHKNPNQVARLIKTLDCDELDFYIHFDSNLELSQNELAEIKAAGNNVFLCEKRIHGELDKWSLIQITLNLVDLVLNNEQNARVKYGYFLLLSGQDYPIKSKEYICDFLEEQYPKPLIDVENGDWVVNKFMIVRWGHKVDAAHSKLKPGLYRKLVVAPYVIAESLEKCFIGAPYDRLKKMGISVWGGSAWWILPHEVIDYLQKFRCNKKIMRELRRGWTPEETFFQTVTMASPFAESASSGHEIYEEGDQQCMTYANFTTPTKSFRGHPYDITTEDFERIMKKKQLFARKFDINTDEKVMDMIDETINGKR